MEMHVSREVIEDELVQELSVLDERLAAVAGLDDRRSKYVAAYLKQLAKNKRNELAALRHQRRRS